MKLFFNFTFTFIFQFYNFNKPQQNEVKYPGNDTFFFKTWCLEGLTPHKKDGPPLCELPPSYNNFNRPNSLLPQVQLN